jgi:hypothetical protein
VLRLSPASPLCGTAAGRGRLAEAALVAAVDDYVVDLLTDQGLTRPDLDPLWAALDPRLLRMSAV